MLLNIYQTFTSDYQEIVKKSKNPRSVSARLTLQLQVSLLLLCAFYRVPLLFTIVQGFQKMSRGKNVVGPKGDA